MKRFVQRIWKDPVLSKVISVPIIGIFSFIYSALRSLLKGVSVIDAFLAFWMMELPLWVIVLILLIGLLVPVLLKKRNNSQFIYDSETLALDREIFNKVRNELLPADGSIDWLREESFRNMFKLEYLDQFDVFITFKSNPNFEFLHPQLEAIKSRLFEAVTDFTYIVSFNTFPANNSNFQAVSSHWDHEKFEHTVSSLQKAKGEVIDNYDSLIKLGRRVLKV